MTVHLTLESKSVATLRLVADFGRGLGCHVDARSSNGRGIRMELPDAHALLELMTQTALGATKTGLDLSEPLCRVTYRHATAPSTVTLGLRLIDFSIDTVGAAET